MKNIPKSQNKNTYSKLVFIPYYSNSQVKYNKNKHDYSFIESNEKSNLKTDINSDELKKVKIKKYPIANYLTPTRNLNAFEKADIESNMTNKLKEKKYQNILLKDKNINYYLTTENSQIKKETNEQKLKLKKDLNKIINDSLSLANNTYKFRKTFKKNKLLKKNKSQNNIYQKNLLFLNSLGINYELPENKNISIDINKAWDYIKKYYKGKNNIDDILRYKILNSILNLIIEKRDIIANEKNNIINKVNDSEIKIKKIKVDKLNEIKYNKKNYIPYDNNRLKMIEIINRSYNLTKVPDKNYGIQ